MNESEQNLKKTLEFQKRMLRLLLQDSYLEIGLGILDSWEMTQSRNLSKHMIILSMMTKEKAQLFPEESDWWLLASMYFKSLAEVMEGLGKKSFPDSENYE